MRAWWIFFLGCTGCAAAPSASGPDPILTSSEPLADVASELSHAIENYGSRTVVAVASFSEPDGKPSGFGAWVADELATRLGQRHRVVERSRLASVLDELALGDLGVGVPSAKVGGAIGAELIVVGTATALRDEIDINARLVRLDTAEVLATSDTRVPDTLAERHGAKFEARQDAPPLALSLSVLGEREFEGRFERIVVQENTVLRSGDGLKITFETNRDAYAYVLLLDSQGRGSVLFPREAIAVEPVLKGGAPVEIPPDEQWFFLDENTGRETLYALAVLKPLSDVAGLVAELERLDARGRDETLSKATEGIVTRGIGGVRPGRTDTVTLTDGQVVERSRELLVGAGAV
ncbi:MAG: FlgO family outer membrane protein, partial [Myxococcota bacterium]